jgi:hypothetical protein
MLRWVTPPSAAGWQYDYAGVVATERPGLSCAISRRPGRLFCDGHRHRSLSGQSGNQMAGSTGRPSFSFSIGAPCVRRC